ncbi:MAG: hypothetical protein AAFX99_01695 [Myxococcota bacterium]
MLTLSMVFISSSLGCSPSPNPPTSPPEVQPPSPTSPDSALSPPPPPTDTSPLALQLTPSSATLDGKVLTSSGDIAQLAEQLRGALNHHPQRQGTTLTVHPEVPYQVFATVWGLLQANARTPITITIAPPQPDRVRHRPDGSTSQSLDAERAYPLPEATREGWGVGLSIGLGHRGAIVAVDGAALPPLPGCPQPGPTVCSLSKASPRDMATDQPTPSSAGPDPLDLRRLYNLVRRITLKHPETQRVTLVAAPDIPFGTVNRVEQLLRHTVPSSEPDGLVASAQALHRELQPDGPIDEVVYGALGP